MKPILPQNAAARLAVLPLPVKFLLSLLCGALIVPAMPPYGLWPLVFAGFTLFYLLLANVRGWGALALGWGFGFGYFGYGLYWIANALLVPGNDYAWVYPFAIAGLPALLAVFTAGAVWLARRMAGGGPLADYLLFCAAIGLAEWLRGHLFTGYPWNLYGYTWAAVPAIAQFAAVGGSYLLTIATILWAAVPGYVLTAARPAGMRAALLAFVSFGLVLAAGAIRLEVNPTVLRDDILVRAVQPNIAQEDKWNPRKVPENFQRHLLMSEARPENASRTTVLIWPETAVPFYVMNDASSRLALRSVLSTYELPVYLVTGLLRRDAAAGAPESEARFFNSLIVLNRDAEALAVYDKAHLVPFGEYLPFQKYMPFGPFAHFAGFDRGPGPATLDVQSLPPFSPLICYEVIFPGSVTDRAGKRPEWLVNITNDAWYGDSMGPRQHFAMIVFRAIEEGVPVIRAANTGISGLVDPLGRVIHSADLFTADDRNLPLPQPLAAPTLFSIYGDLLFFISVAGLAVCGFWLGRRSF